MKKISRREFIKCLCAGAGAGSCFLLDWPDSFSALMLWGDGQVKAQEGQVREEMFYRQLDSMRIACEICPRRCVVSEGKRGYCRNKENRGGKYYSLVYNQVCAAHIDPIEKKPFFHYLPGTRAFSIAAAGCNFACKFCQNWEISQARPEDIPNDPLTPDQAIKICRDQDIPTIAYTYSEPTVFYSSMFDMARQARAAGIGSVMISNGFMNEMPLRQLCKQLTAVRIDLKSFSDEFYRTMCSGSLAPVLATLQRLKEIGIWFEIIALIIPTLNDNPDDIQKMCVWIKANLGPDVPIHFSRFHPMYQLQNLPPTPVRTLEMARETAFSAGLHFPYIGNVPGHEGENTFCPFCKKMVIRRIGFEVVENSIEKGACTFCRQPIAGVWSKEQINV